jgi:hypothetical protein
VPSSSINAFINSILAGTGEDLMAGAPLERLNTVVAWEMFRKPPAKDNFAYNLKRLSGGGVV